MTYVVKGSYLAKAILAASALSVVLGAVQLASGHDLLRSGMTASNVNRAAKSDRAATPVLLPQQAISFQPSGLAATSVVVRAPLPKAAGVPAPSPRRPQTLFKSGQDKPAIACEPMVSVLTEVAKKLLPGRCVT